MAASGDQHATPVRTEDGFKGCELVVGVEGGLIIPHCFP